MAKADDIINLIKAHMEDDGKKFDMCVAAIVANLKAADNAQSRNLSERIEHVLRNSQARWITMSPSNAFYTKDVLDGGLAWVESSTVKLADMVLDDDLRGALTGIMQERAATEKLRTHKLEPARKILCYGPPGTGKTMSASAIAGELDLPLYIVSAEKVIGQYLGNTAQNLGKIFNVIKRAEGVWFFDEFDSLARARTGSGADGNAEMSRVMGSLLQFIERDASNSIIMAATNMPSLLDKALYRRFDVVLHYELPSQQQIRSLVMGTAQEVGLEGVLSLIPPEQEMLSSLAGEMKGFNHATVVRTCKEAAKKLVLADAPLQWETFLPAIKENMAVQGKAQLCSSA